MDFRVTATSLNLRSAPKVAPNNRIATLPQAQIVTKIADSATAGWWKIQTTLSGAIVVGFVNAAFLEPATNPAPLPVSGVTAVHLPNKPGVVRQSTAGRANHLSEAGMPTRPAGSSEPGDLTKIVNWLRVSQSARYQPTTHATFCNIYAYDYCYLSGFYMPRVWWSRAAIAKLTAGQSVQVQYGVTVSELNANSLCMWFEEFGGKFGWRRTFDLDELQNAVNAGKGGIIVAQRADLSRSGHIQAIVPENGPHTAKRVSGKVKDPLESQAGARNFEYGQLNSKWWASPNFRDHGFWING